MEILYFILILIVIIAIMFGGFYLGKCIFNTFSDAIEPDEEELSDLEEEVDELNKR